MTGSACLPRGFSHASTARTRFETNAAGIEKIGRPPLTPEHNMNYVLYTFYMEGNVIRAVVEEAAALVSIALFIGMIAIWAEVVSSGL
jgi:hypothetical protein